MLEDTPPLDADDYPLVKFWYKRSYCKENTKRRKLSRKNGTGRGISRASQDENVSFWFLYNADGTTVNSDVVSSLRADAKLVWTGMCEDYGPMGLPWTEVPIKHLMEFWLRLERSYPFLRLCANHYKADAVATSDYTNWYNNHVRKRRRVAKPARARKSRPYNSPSRRGSRRRIEDEDESDDAVESDEQHSDDDYEEAKQENEDDEDEDEDEDGDDEDQAIDEDDNRQGNDNDEEKDAEGERDTIPPSFLNARGASRASSASLLDGPPAADNGDGTVRVSLFESTCSSC